MYTASRAGESCFTPCSILRTPASLDFVRQSVKETAVVGIKIHPSMHQCPADDDRYWPVWEFAATARLPILTHSWCLSE